MILVVARLKAKQGERGRVAEINRPCIDETRREDGCVSYELLASTENETDLVFVERWRDKDSLRAHLKADHLRHAKEARAPFVEGGVEISLFSATPDEL